MASGSGVDRRARGGRVHLTDHQALVARVDQCPKAEWSGTAWRHLRVGRDPKSGVGARLVGGRWNPPESFAVLYLGATRAAVIAEFRRLMAKQSFGARDLMPRALYRFHVELVGALDLRDSATRELIGLTDQQLYGEDRSACQAVGEAAFATGRTAVIAPSATGQDDVLAIYLEHIHGSSRLDVGDHELWDTPP